MQPMINDSTTAFLRAVRMNFMNFDHFVIEEIRTRSWASATFAGARHELTFRVEGDGAEEVADGFLATLEAAEFTLRGHIMADIAEVSREGLPDGIRISLEALTVEDC